MGATTDGRDAVFALGAGVSAKGRATCRPSHDQCALISVPAGATERVSWPFRADQQRSMQLTVTRITKRVIKDRKAAKAAIDRQSQIGRCDLELGDPIEYQYRHDGQLQKVANSAPACTKATKRVALAFPGTTEEYGEVAVLGATSDDGTVAFPGMGPVDER